MANEINNNIKNGIKMCMAVVDLREPQLLGKRADEEVIIWEGAGVWCEEFFNELSKKLGLKGEFEDYVEVEYGADWSVFEFGDNGFGIMMMDVDAEGEDVWLDFLDSRVPGWDD
jgi:hypothetical protein